MNVIIIDDERKARNVLKTLLIENCPKISNISEAENLIDGISLIKKENPEIVFLDIEMPEHSGLEILDFIDKEAFNFEIIFTTAYSEYALQAFQLTAIEYLLKPVRPTQIKEAVEKAITHIDKSQINERLIELKSCLQQSDFKKIGLPYANGIKFVAIDQIIMFEADGMYTNVFVRDDSNFLVSKPIKFFVETLKNNPTFFKPHRSFFVNLKYLKEYVKKDGGYIVMDNNKSVSLSKDKKELFLEIIQSIS